MHLSIKYKLMFIFFAAILLVVLTINAIGQWSFHRGFVRFVSTIEQARLEQLADDLTSLYADDGNWDSLRGHPALWLNLLRRSDNKHTHPPIPPRDEERLMRLYGGPNHTPPPKPPHDKRRHFEARVVLLDENSEVLFGFPQIVESIVYLPLKQNNTVVGRLGLAPQEQLEDVLQLQFIEEQKTAFRLIALGIVLCSAFLTLPMTNRLVRPVTSLVAATRELTSGNYKTRTPVKTEDELGQLSRDFNTLAETLEQNEKARQQWVADISHELRTPLAVLRGEIEAMQDQVREATPENLKVLHGEVLQLNRLISDLYELSMSDLGALTYKKEMITPVDVLQTSIDVYQARFDNHSLKMEMNLSSGADVEMLADQERLQQLFSNLLENSLRYTETDGCLEVRTEVANSQLKIHFLDSEPGVKERELEKLFDRLYRVEASRNRAIGGAGLGLSICRNIVEAHAGTIEARPSPHGGLWIVVSLPLNG